ncbi:tyrosine-type recombinase/integrase [Fictibacillus halophilus]|uniref:site-specific integrase n=1 Tax=Fictibacillus halophilus TaxID=1610490 RepID=UPI0036279B0D
MAKLDQITKGNWYYRIRYKDPVSNKWREKKKTGFKTKAEANVAAIKMENKLKSGIDVDHSGKTLLKDHLASWLKYKKPGIQKNTFEQHEYNINKKIIPYFQNIAIKNITRKRYDDFILSLVNQGYKKRTIEIIHTTMRAAMGQACEYKMIEENPSSRTKIPLRSQSNEEKLEYIEKDDIPDLLNSARKEPPHYYRFFLTLLDCGLRKGEAAALQRKDIDFKNNEITINKSLDFKITNLEDERIFGDTKTYESRRKVQMTKRVAQELHEHMKYLNAQRIRFNDEYIHHLDLVFCREDGRPLPKSTLQRVFKRVQEKAGLKPISIHGLRHTHAVMLLESKNDINLVSKRLGHRDITVTSNTYGHISDKLMISSVDQYEKYMDSLSDVKEK